ncbi:TetR/AcrR family transcriptional regulator [Streptomyces massasporeus]
MKDHGGVSRCSSASGGTDTHAPAPPGGHAYCGGEHYRHFPTKTDLVAAVVAEYTTHVAEAAEAARERLASGSRAVDEITGFLAGVTEATATNHAVKAAARTLGADPVDRDAETRAGTALAALIQAGQADGDIHRDVTVDDIYLLFSTAPTDQPPAARARWLTLVLTGLTTHNRTDATGPRPSPSTARADRR